MDYELSHRIFKHWLPNGVFNLTVEKTGKNYLKGSGSVVSILENAKFEIQTNVGALKINRKNPIKFDSGVLAKFFSYPFEFEVNELSNDQLVEFSIKTKDNCLPREFYNVWAFELGTSGFDYPDSRTISRTNGTGDLNMWKITGSTVYRNTVQILERYLPGYGNDSVKILEWGCGCGNAARFFLNDKKFEYMGIDMDPIVSTWCKNHLDSEKFIQNDFFPPTSFPDDSYDAIFSMSVMTHLIRSDQLSWLEELHRLLKKGGLALLSFHGPAQMSKFNDPTNHLKNLFENEFTEDLIPNKDLIDLAHGSRYIGTAFTYAYIKKNWSDYFEVRAILDNCFGLHAVVVLAARK